MKCGKPIDDSATVCPYCNTEVDRAKVDEAIEAQKAKEEAERKKREEEMRAVENANKVTPMYDKPSKKPLFIALGAVAALVLAICGIVFWLNRPINKVNKAIENNDIKTVNEYYDKLSDTDKSTVEEKMLEYGVNLCDAYIDNTKEYSDIKSYINELSKGVLKDNTRFAEKIVEVENLNKSRESFEAANKAFDEEDYEKALALYGEVIENDSNYDTALDKIEKCEAKIAPSVVGKWQTTIDLGDVMLAEVGLTSSEQEFSFPIVLIYEFKEDGTGIVSMDENGVKEHMEEFVNIAVDEVIKQYKLIYGMTEEDIDKEFKEFYGVGFREYMAQMLEEEDSLDNLEQFNEEFTYVLEEDRVAIDSKESGIIYLDIVDDTLQLKDLDYEEYAAYTQLGIELPLVFNKSE